MLLAIDAGNTSLAFGVFSGEKITALWRRPSEKELSLGILARELRRQAEGRRLQIDRAVFASVVPALDRTIARAVRSAFSVSAIQIGPGALLGLRFGVKNPEEVGADRVANAVAARELYGLPAVVIDFGTATTLDCVSSGGTYLGGAILPGPMIMAEALRDKTAKLPLVEPRRFTRAIGKDTIECIRAGLYRGYLGMVERLLDQSLSEMGVARRKAKILATGGYARVFQKDLPSGAVFAPHLTLQGLRIAFEKIAGSGS